ncbi:OprD family outer membrane porin, partial [Pseudomonas sp. HMSC75E02]|uniref:OprD family outer membrane porin n=1 Tax=Pseudomonas sp. HMSC75E02 TaxID=1608908 RepID=UPI00114D3D5D
MSNRVCVTAVALGIGVAAAQPAAAAEGLIEGASATLQARNYYFSRDFSDIVGPNRQSKAEEWAQGFILDFRSGYTPGPIGFGLDAIGVLGLKLDSSPERTNSGLLPVGGDGRAPDDYSRLGVA